MNFDTLTFSYSRLQFIRVLKPNYISYVEVSHLYVEDMFLSIYYI